MRLTEPTPVRLHPPRRRLILSLLECSGLDDLARAIADGLAAAEHLQPIDLFGIAVEVLSLRPLDVDVRGRRLRLRGRRAFL